MTTITVHLNITGRVQGVGYRESLRLVADALAVTGWVRNCADGNVEATLQGEEQAVEGVIAWCHNGPPDASVQYVNTNLLTTEKHYTAFARLPDATTNS
jgi:acylphosphatase